MSEQFLNGTSAHNRLFSNKTKVMISGEGNAESSKMAMWCLC